MLVMAVFWYRSAMMELVLQQLLERTTGATSKLSGFRFGFDRADLSEMAFEFETGSGLLSARLENISAGYDPSVPKIGAVTVARASLKYRYRPTDAPGTVHENKRGAIALPLERLSVERLNIDIDTPWGMSRFAGRGEIGRGNDNSIETFFLDAGQAVRFRFGADFGKASISVERMPGGKVFELNAERLDQPDKQAKLHADAGPFIAWLSKSSWVPKTLRANMTASGVSQATPNLSPMRLDIAVATDDNIGTIQGSADLTRSNRILAHADLSMATVPETLVDVDGRLDMAAMELFDLLKPWLPQTASSWHVSSGSVRAATKLHWQPHLNTIGTGHLNASDLALSAGSVKLRDGSIEASIEDFAKHAVALSAKVRTLELGKEISAGNLIVDARYLDRQLTLERAVISIFGGLLEVVPDSVDTGQLPVPLTLRVQNLDLSQLLSGLHYPDLSGSGNVSGELPLRLSADTIELRDGTLTGMRPGVIRYRGPVADNENLAFRALRNLKYHSLQAKVNYRPNGDYRFGFRIEGNNPEVLSGHPLAFNLNVGGQLPELLRRGIQAGDFDRAIMEQTKTKPADNKKP